ncbi:MAG: carboxypeptidase regulatory-like domain-containing protein [Planctomycetes bacterium]|nr:carboxypeptidase regulatory-like domain-containing protein [Planctomycetota bacterium]
MSSTATRTRRALGVVIALLIPASLGLWLALSHNDSPGAASSLEPLANSTAVSAASASEAPAPAATRIEEPRLATPQTAAPTPLAEAVPSQRVTGRCVASADLRPLAGLSARIHVLGVPVRELAATSDADGRFEFVFDPALVGPQQLVLAIENAGYGGTAVTPAVGHGRDTGSRRARVRHGLRLLGTPGPRRWEPIAEASVTIGNAAARTDSSGRFAMLALLPVGASRVLVQAAGHALLQRSVTVPEDDGTTFVLVAARTIGGYVLDETGRPYEGVTVHADGSPLPRFGVSDAEGRFEIADTLGIQSETELHVLPGTPRAWHSGVRYRWGTRDVTVRLERPLAFDLVVVDQTSGAPIEEYAIHLLTNQRPAKGSLRDAGHHPGGKLRVADVPRGAYKLWVVPAGEEHAPAERVPVIVMGALAEPIRVELERRVELHAEVLDAHGRAVEGARVELVRAPLGRALHALDEPLADDGGLFRSEADAACSIDVGTTDARGRVTLRSVPSRGQLFPGSANTPSGVVFPKLHLSASAPGNVRSEVEAPPAESTGEAPVRIVLRHGGTVAGRVVPAAALALQPRIFLTTPGEGFQVEARVSLRREKLLEPDAEGRFTAGPLPAGECVVRVLLQGKRESISVGTCVIAEGAETALVVDLHAHLPAAVSVRVQDAPSDWKLRVLRGSSDGTRSSESAGQHAIDAEGRTEPFTLLPGTYAFVLVGSLDARGSRRDLQHMLGRAELGASEKRTLEFAYRPRRLELIVRRADGSLVREATRVRAVESGAIHQPTIGEGGALVFDPGPIGSFFLRIENQRYPDSEAEIEPSPGSEAWKLEVQLAR